MWPSTGNYCYGVCLTEKIAADIEKTRAGEGSIKAMLDIISNKIVEEAQGRVHCMNQFMDFSNQIWHYKARKTLIILFMIIKEEFLQNIEQGVQIKKILVNDVINPDEYQNIILNCLEER